MGVRRVSPEEGRGGPHSVHCAALPRLESHVVTGYWRFQSCDELGGSGHPSKRFGLMNGQSAPCGHPGSTSTGSLPSLSVLHSGLISSSQHHSPDTEPAWSCQSIITPELPVHSLAGGLGGGAAWGSQNVRDQARPVTVLFIVLLGLEESVSQTGRGFVSHFPVCLCHCEDNHCCQLTHSNSQPRPRPGPC